jgi:hypothetical protein
MDNEEMSRTARNEDIFTEAQNWVTEDKVDVQISNRFQEVSITLHYVTLCYCSLLAAFVSPWDKNTDGV